MFTTRKKHGIRPLQFITLWVAGYLGASLLGDLVWSIFYDLVDGLTNSAEFFGFVVMLAIGSLFFVAFYWMQKQLIQRLFHVDLRHWIAASLGGWVVGFLVMYVLIEWLEVSSAGGDGGEMQIVSVIVLSTVLLQWWLLRPIIQKAWMWVAVHVVFVLLTAFFVGDDHVFIVLLYSLPEISFNDNFMLLKGLAIAYGVSSGLTLLWLRRGELRKPKAKFVTS